MLALPLLGAAPAPEERGFNIGSFERVRIEGPYDVALSIGSPHASASGTASSLDHVSVRVDGSTLIVSAGTLGRASAGDTLPRVLVSGPAPRTVLVSGGGKLRISEMRGARADASVNGAGSLEVESLVADDFGAALTGTGAIRLAGTVGRLRLRNIGTGSIDAQALTANDAVLSSEGTGTISATVRYTARATALGTGGINIAGKPECTLSGSGPISCDGRIVRR
ncbi:GIN domain-containing protein [Sphingomonas sp. MMS12-HWE2-04]|uniref:GIN domain-containing protein n=1 Tax=Sphingomonas sp. MMS12-HWE2-04 TaxID=3234199 RepID=UPI0038504D81